MLLLYYFLIFLFCYLKDCIIFREGMKKDWRYCIWYVFDVIFEYLLNIVENLEVFIFWF